MRDCLSPRNRTTSPQREIVSKASASAEACNGTNVWRIYLLMVNSALTQCSVAFARCTRATYFAACTIDHVRLFAGLRSTRVMNGESQKRCVHCSPSSTSVTCVFTRQFHMRREFQFTYLMMKKNMSIGTVRSCASECVCARASKIDYKRSGIKSVSSIY